MRRAVSLGRSSSGKKVVENITISLSQTVNGCAYAGQPLAHDRVLTRRRNGGGELDAMIHQFI